MLKGNETVGPRRCHLFSKRLYNEIKKKKSIQLYYNKLFSDRFETSKKDEITLI